jgi:hypothetical protein
MYTTGVAPTTVAIDGQFAAATASPLDLGTSFNPYMYYKGGAARLVDVNYDTGFASRWFGYIGVTRGSRLTGAEILKGWHHVASAIAPPIVQASGFSADTDATVAAPDPTAVGNITAGLQTFGDTGNDNWAQTWECAISYVYGGNQESLLAVFDSTAVVSSDNAVHIILRIGTQTASTDLGINERITAVKLYLRVSGTEAWFLEGIFDLVADTGAAYGKPPSSTWFGDAAPTPDTIATSAYDSVYLTSSAVSALEAPAELSSYEAETGIPQAEGDIEARYKTSVIVGNRLHAMNVLVSRTTGAATTSGTLVVGQQYVITDFQSGDDFANVGASSNNAGVKFIATGTTPTTWTNSSELTPVEEDILGDAMIVSQPGKFDILPLSKKIDIITQDGDSYYASAAFAERVLAFKGRTLYVVNVGSGDPASYFQEDNYPLMGAWSQRSVAATPFGVCWANENGCFIYDGKVAQSLTDKRLKSTWKSVFANAGPGDNDKPPVVGYDKKQKHLIVLVDDDSSLVVYAYAFSTGAWQRGTINIQFSGAITGKSNFAYNKDGDLELIMQVDSNPDIFKKWDGDGAVHTIDVKTKEFDMGSPGADKKIYKAIVTSKRADGATVDDVIDSGTTPSFAGALSSGATRKDDELEVAVPAWQKTVQLRIQKSSANAALEIDSVSLIVREKRVKN